MEPSRALVSAHREKTAAIAVLDLTAYEIGNALLRGPARASADQVTVVLDALGAICPAVRPSDRELRLAAELAELHELTLYDAAYAAIAESRGALLATLDGQLIGAGLGSRPSDVLRALERPAGT